jgi:hypothetical protein
MGKARDLCLAEEYLRKGIINIPYGKGSTAEVSLGALQAHIVDVDRINKKGNKWVDREDYNPEFWLDQEEFKILKIAISKIMDGELSAQGFMDDSIFKNMMDRR